MKSYQRLRLILGDQLNAKHSWYQDKSTNALYVIAELRQETDYVRHHIQKVQAFFAAMTGFADGLQQAGLNVLHLTLDDTQDYATLPDLLEHLLEQYQCEVFEYQQPDEYRLHQQLNEYCQQLDIESECYDTGHFVVPFTELGRYFAKDKNGRMETFYRKLRKQHQLLMEGDEPAGGQWNFDKDNRQKLKKSDLKDIPEPLCFDNDVTAINQRLYAHEIETISTGSDRLLWPVNRKQAVSLLEYFCEHCLPNFGRFQDAMTQYGKDDDIDRQWSLYHSRLSFALNSKMLSPMQVIRCALSHYQHNEQIDIAQIEGFVRQILGWREFVRGVYWTHMPEYGEHNHLEAKRGLPAWFWTADTKMNCLHHAIKQSLEYSYAHHIQRLMVTGNFCMLAGIDPDEVDAWYLGIYIDALEWVEMPNTRGMSQYADGGIVGSKAYAASGNYVNKMSDYCQGCHYKVKEKHTDKACPFNSLYWHFMLQHRERFEKNPRIGMVYRNWDKQSEDSQDAALQKAQQLLEAIETL